MHHYLHKRLMSLQSSPGILPASVRLIDLYLPGDIVESEPRQIRGDCRLGHVARVPHTHYAVGRRPRLGSFTSRHEGAGICGQQEGDFRCGVAVVRPALLPLSEGDFLEVPCGLFGMGRTVGELGLGVGEERESETHR